MGEGREYKRLWKIACDDGRNGNQLAIQGLLLLQIVIKLILVLDNGNKWRKTTQIHDFTVILHEILD